MRSPNRSRGLSIATVSVIHSLNFIAILIVDIEQIKLYGYAAGYSFIHVHTKTSLGYFATIRDMSEIAVKPIQFVNLRLPFGTHQSHNINKITDQAIEKKTIIKL